MRDMAIEGMAKKNRAEERVAAEGKGRAETSQSDTGRGE